MGRFRMTAAGFALVLVAAFAVAEAWRPPAPPGGLLDVELASSLRSFADCTEFLDTVRGEALDHVSAYGLTGGVQDDMFREEAAMDGGFRNTGAVVSDMAGSVSAGAAEGAPVPAPQAMESTADAGAGGGVEVSGTNVQERGVDEPDVVKSDGRVLAAVARERLQLVDLRDDGRLAATVPLSDGWGHELLLHDGRLLVTGNVHDPEAAQPGMERLSIAPMGATKAELTLLDVSDPASPETLGSVRLDGQIVSSRLVDGMVRVVLRSNPQPAMTHPQPGPAEDLAAMRELESQAAQANRDIVERSQATDWLPAYTVHDGDGDTVTEAPLVDCADVRYPEQFRGFGMLSVMALSMTADQAGALVPTGTASVLGDGDTVYATPERLYVAINRWGDPGPVPMPGPAELVDPVAEAPMPVEPDGGIGDGAGPPADQPMPVEPDGGIGDGAGPPAGEEPAEPPAAPDPPLQKGPPPPPRNIVEIHEFDTTDPARPVYTASGSVPGHLLNQWALSFHDGHLRVATTEGMEGFDAATESAVHVLRREGGDLVEVGRAGGLGRGERIYAVRYFGDYGFVVTFRQTDPLYALDLSDPAAPRVLGELKIPGFSSYLHPLGDGLLLGVGQDADERTGRALGVQVSLFDVSDLSAPRRVSNLTLESESSSEVEHDHRAFLWWPAAKRAVLPYMRHQWSESDQRETGFFGALALEVDGDVREAGRITHQEAATTDPWWSQVRRAIVVGDTLYTMSERGVMAHGVDDLAERRFLEFEGPTPADFREEPVMEESFAEGRPPGPAMEPATESVVQPDPGRRG